MARRLILSIAACALAGCSLVTSGDDATYLETNPGEVCDDSSECASDAICPRFADYALAEEVTSYCYIECDGKPEVCEGTGYPTCFDYVTESVCTGRATLEGTFRCKEMDLTLGNKVTLTLEVLGDPDAEPTVVELDECVLWVDYESDGASFIFSTLRDDRYFDVVVGSELLDPMEVDIGPLEDLGGMARESRVEDMDVMPELLSSHVRAFFPPESLKQDSPHRSRVEITSFGDDFEVIIGEIEMEGFLYDAELDVDMLQEE